MTLINKKLSLLDINQAAFLLLAGIPPELELQNGTVLFVFPANEQTYELSQIWTQNPEGRLGDYATCLKTLRARMLSMKKH